MGNILLEGLSALTRKVMRVTNDIYMLDFRIVNAYMVAAPPKWVLVDTGLENSANFIAEAAENRFGLNAYPEAVILTHGHFDHAGSLKTLVSYWDVPAFIHPFELPYITGKKDYPFPDSSAGKGYVTKISPTFPHTAIDIGHYAAALPGNHSVPGLPEWRWIHTAGHTSGHISLFRERDRVLISGDALSTVNQESFWSVLTQREALCGPPAYLTEDFKNAQGSVERLIALAPSLVLPSHGRPIQGENLRKYVHIITETQDVLGKPAIH